MTRESPSPYFYQHLKPSKKAIPFKEPDEMEGKLENSMFPDRRLKIFNILKGEEEIYM